MRAGIGAALHRSRWDSAANVVVCNSQISRCTGLTWSHRAIHDRDSTCVLAAHRVGRIAAGGQSGAGCAHVPVRPVGLMGCGGGHGLVPRPSDQGWSMALRLMTVASSASAIAGPLSATGSAAVTPRSSGLPVRDSGGAGAPRQRLRGRLQRPGAGSAPVLRSAPVRPWMRGLVSAPHGTRLCTWL